MCALISHSRRAAAASYDGFDDRASLQLLKYLPLTPSTCGDEAR
jgi:hypothetical protein